MFENMVLRKIFGPGGKKEEEAGENSIMNIYIICTPRQILLG
jgi:hypothetical protein